MFAISRSIPETQARFSCGVDVLTRTHSARRATCCLNVSLAISRSMLETQAGLFLRFVAIVNNTSLAHDTTFASRPPNNKAPFTRIHGNRGDLPLRPSSASSACILPPECFGWRARRARPRRPARELCCRTRTAIRALPASNQPAAPGTASLAGGIGFGSRSEALAAALTYARTPAAASRFNRTTFLINCKPQSPSQVSMDSG